MTAQGLEELAKTVAEGEVLSYAFPMHAVILENREQLCQLLVPLIAVPALDNYTVFRVASHRDRRVIDEDALRQRPPDETELLEVDTTKLRAMLTVKAVRDERACRVKGVNHLVCIALLRRCEDNELKRL